MRTELMAQLLASLSTEEASRRLAAFELRLNDIGNIDWATGRAAPDEAALRAALRDVFAGVAAFDLDRAVIDLMTLPQYGYAVIERQIAKTVRPCLGASWSILSWPRGWIR